MALLGAAVLLWCTMCTEAQGSQPVPIDFSQQGQTFDGVGALSGGGGTSRLLYDYSEPQRTTILDALFVPQGGGSLQIFKVEIGGDGQSTEATEPSHMHTADDENYARGYEFWLMKEAKKRNPDIKLYALSWTVPAWVGDGQHGPGSQAIRAGDDNYYSQNNLDYHMKYLKGVKRVHNLTIDYVGIWNEAAYSSDWIIRFRQALDADADTAGMKIVAADKDWSPICDDMMSNGTLRDAVAILGAHYPVKAAGAPATPTSCQQLNTQHGKPLWTSEGWSLSEVNDWHGAMNLALTLNQNYVKQQQTAMIVWNLIFSWYSIFPFAHPDGTTVGGMGHGLMSATEPWSGHYRIQPTLYAVAHTTQFTTPGKCRYIKNTAVGQSPGGWIDSKAESSIVVFACGSSDWTAVIETMSATSTFAQPTRIVLRNLPSSSLDSVHVVRTCENATEWFRRLPDIKISNGQFSLQLIPQCVFTISTLAGGNAVPNTTIPPSSHLSVTYQDSFDSYPDQSPAKYFTDEGGSFNAEKDSGNAANGVLKQAVAEKPVHGAWWNDGEPWTVMGDSQSPVWSNYTVAVRARIDGPASSPIIPSPSPGPEHQITIVQSSSASVASGQCLNVVGQSTKDGTDIMAYACGETRETPQSVGLRLPNEEWNTDGGTLKSLGKCATVGAQGSVQLFTCNGSASQKWAVKFPKVLDSNGLCLGLGGNDPQYPHNKLAVVSACSDSDATQVWSNGSPAFSVVPSPQFVRVCGRISSFKPDGTPPQGYCLIVDSNHTWYLAAGGSKGPAGRDLPRVVATGALPTSVGPLVGQWVSLKITMSGATLSPYVNGIELPTLTDHTFTHGMVAMGSGWHLASFDDFSLNPAE